MGVGNWADQMEKDYVPHSTSFCCSKLPFAVRTHFRKGNSSPWELRRSYHPGLGSLTSEDLSVLFAGELGGRSQQ